MKIAAHAEFQSTNILYTGTKGVKRKTTFPM